MKGGSAELTAEPRPNAEQGEIKHNHFLHRVWAADSQLVKNVASLIYTSKEKRVVLLS